MSWRVSGGSSDPPTWANYFRTFKEECPHGRPWEDHREDGWIHIEKFPPTQLGLTNISSHRIIKCQPAYHVLRIGERPTFAQYMIHFGQRNFVHFALTPNTEELP